MACLRAKGRRVSRFAPTATGPLQATGSDDGVAPLLTGGVILTRANDAVPSRLCSEVFPSRPWYGRIGSVRLPPAGLRVRARLLRLLEAMTCPEARQFHAALIAGELRISETALVEAHLSRCADCRQIAESLYRVAPRDSEGRIVLAGAGDMRIGAGSRLLLPLLLLVALGASALVVVPGLAPYAWHRASALVVAARHATLLPTTPTAPPLPEPSRIEPPSEAPVIREPDVISPSSPSASSVSLAATSPSAPTPAESQQTAAAPTELSNKETERASAAPAPSASTPSARHASTQPPAESAATASARKAEPRQARQGEQA